MIYTKKIKDAIKFSIKTHEIDQKQKRKGKDIPYVTHPLIVGMILAKAGADEDIVIAGILHDTVEDSVKDNKVTPEMLMESFGEKVANLVLSVTERNKELSWVERKAEALEHIKTFSHDSLMLKSADIISNTTEIIDDYIKDGEKTFSRFNAPKEKLLQAYINVIETILNRWIENPLSEDLQKISEELNIMKRKEHAL